MTFLSYFDSIYNEFSFTEMAGKKSSKNPRKGIYPKGMEALTACPLCQAEYKPAQARILGEGRDRHFLHIQCGQCGNSILVLLSSGAGGMYSVGMVTDLTGDDALRFKDSFVISADDVIGIHEILKKGKVFVEKLKNI